MHQLHAQNGCLHKIYFERKRVVDHNADSINLEIESDSNSTCILFLGIAYRTPTISFEACNGNVSDDCMAHRQV
jgi:hypothetical protein